MKTVLFCDIDDTLMQTLHKCPVQDISQQYLQIGALDKQGEPLSYMSLQQQQLLKLFTHDDAAMLIPVTGRNIPALERTTLNVLKIAPYRITGHGAMISNANGKKIHDWACPSTFILAQQSLLAMEERVSQWVQSSSSSARCHIVCEMNVPVYISIKERREYNNAAFFNALRTEFEAYWHTCDGRLHINGNNAAFLPAFADKSRAVRFVQQNLEQQWGACLWIGAGDSLSDKDFLMACDYQLIPTNSQLSAA